LAAERPRARARPARVVPPPEDPQVVLERERRERPLAVGAAAVAAVLPLFASIYVSSTTRDRPNNDPGTLLFYDRHGTPLLLAAVFTALGAVAMGVVLLFLYRFVKARRPQLPNVARVCAIAGPAILLVAQITVQLIIHSKAHAFATTGGQTYEEARKVFDNGSLRAVATASLAGQLALAFAAVIISLNGMRAGLLTRFMGVLGIITGILIVIPVGSPLPIVQSFWFAALAFLFAGRWPSGMPAAWNTGEAQSWPSQQELRERAVASRAEKRTARGEANGRDDAGAAPEPEATVATADGSDDAQAQAGASQKRKRKRRR
jgi:hypothetical protein